MSESLIQDKYLMSFFTERADGLKYQEVKANTVSPSLFIEDDLLTFIRDTSLNEKTYPKLLKQFRGDEKALIKEFTDFLSQRRLEPTNMAIFFNNNKSVTFKGVKIYLFYPSGSEIHEDRLFEENIFSIVQELPYTYKHERRKIFSFRPDLVFFLNGIFWGYSELKSNFTSQNARKDGRQKVINDYRRAAVEYLQISEGNDLSQSIRKDFLKVFEKAIHITSTDLKETYIIRNISTRFNEIKRVHDAGRFDYQEYETETKKVFKMLPLPNSDADSRTRFEQMCRILYDKRMVEKEILYYNFIERKLEKQGKDKVYKDRTGNLIAPRPKQKYGVDRIMEKIDEFLQHEHDDEYFLNKLRDQLRHLSKEQREELVAKRLKYQNNRNVYSLLLQYAAGFGKSNIIGWAALQLKDLRKNGKYVYDKVMIVVDRIQLRDQLDSKMLNMNINKKMFVEAKDKDTFKKALSSDTRIIVVNVQKFNAIRQFLSSDVLARLIDMRIVFLIDEIHRSHGGKQNEEMITLFDELQSSFDQNESYQANRKKKNLIIGFTATPSDHSLARFGEFNKYAEAEKIWVPFDAYTMKQAIEDKYILNPIKGIVPVASKMYFEIPDNELEGFEEEPTNYRIRNKNIYENDERIQAIARFIVARLLNIVYHTIRGTGKAMLAVSSIPAAIKYFGYLKQYYAEMIQEKKHERFKDAPIYIVYSSDGQKYQSASSLNGGLSEEKVLQNFRLAKNGLMVVVNKLQTGYDEPRLHTLFLDKEIRGINAIQTISRVNRKTKYKEDCKIVDFSHKNVNVNNIKKAFEHFSNVVVSDFDPLGDEKRLIDHYHDLIAHQLYKNNFEKFKTYNNQPKEHVQLLLEIQEAFEAFIHQEPDHAKQLKVKVNKYFYLLGLIEFVIDLGSVHKDRTFLRFWRRFNNVYNTQNKSEDRIDDVAIYFDNQIGITEHPPEFEEREDGKREPSDNGSPTSPPRKYDVLKEIEKRNKEEEAIEELILAFREKIDNFFAYIQQPEVGKNLIAKMKDTAGNFTQEEKLEDFSRIFRKYIRRNKKELGAFFMKEARDNLNQLYNDFEKVMVK